MDEERTKPRIGNLGALTLLALAALFDATQAFFILVGIATGLGIVLVPLVSLVVGICAYVALFLAIKLAFRNVQFFGGRKAALKTLGILTSIGIEFIPFVQALPGIFSFVLTIIIATRIEDTFGGEGEVSALVQQRQERAVRLRDMQQGRLERATRRDETRGDNKEAQKAARKNERELKQEDRKRAMENFGITARAATGNTSKRTLQGQTPGVLQETRPQEEGLSGFKEDLERLEQY